MCEPVPGDIFPTTHPQLSEMHKITIIAAVASDEAIGRDGKLIFNIRDDLRRFKRLTMGHTMIMGRHTFESLPGILPGRRHIVVSRRKGYAPKGAEVAPSLERAISMCGGEDEIMIIGGGQIYAAAIPLATHMELTRVDAPAPGADTYFPHMDTSRWSVSAADGPHVDPATGLSYTFFSYTATEPK